MARLEKCVLVCVVYVCLVFSGLRRVCLFIFMLFLRLVSHFIRPSALVIRRGEFK